jgi:hypothetical protein
MSRLVDRRRLRIPYYILRAAPRVAVVVAGLSWMAWDSYVLYQIMIAVQR